MMKNTVLFLVGFFTLSACSYGQVDFEKFNQGYYITADSQKITGLIKYVKGANARIEYKEAANSKKKKIYPDECKEFGFDSATHFIRCPRAVTIRLGVWNYVVDQDFIRVFEVGKICLYKHYAMLGNSSKMGGPPDDIETIIMKRGDSGNLVALHPNKKKTKERLDELFPGEPEIAEKFLEADWDEWLKFVHEYNSR